MKVGVYNAEKKMRNKYKSSRYKLGDYIDILNGLKNNRYKIVQVIPEDGYNKYLCVNKLGLKTMITDKDYYITINDKKMIQKR